MSEWMANKGYGPWAFVKGPNKYNYNEGDVIAAHTNPIWVPDSPVFGTTPITPTHKPCGYWHDRPYVAPPLVPIVHWDYTFGAYIYLLTQSADFAYGSQLSITHTGDINSIAFLIGGDNAPAVTATIKLALYNTSGGLLASCLPAAITIGYPELLTLDLITPYSVTSGDTVMILMNSSATFSGVRENSYNRYFVSTPYSSFPPASLSLSYLLGGFNVSASIITGYI